MNRLILLLPLALAACAGGQRAAETAALPAADWRKIATQADRARIRDWRGAFVSALERARAGGHTARIAREGALLDPDAAVTGGDIPAGDYRCRVIKLGGKDPGMLDYVAYPSFVCRVAEEGGIASFTKMTGSQRPVGLIFDHEPHRQIFLGTLMLGDERRALDYGRDAERDMAGAVEKIGAERWRIILPWPHFESMMDVVELVPVRT